jgi:hypothetical protein
MRYLTIFLTLLPSYLVNGERFSASNAMEKLAQDEEVILKEFGVFAARMKDESDYINK